MAFVDLQSNKNKQNKKNADEKWPRSVKFFLRKKKIRQQQRHQL